MSVAPAGRRTKLSVLSADLPPEASLQANALPFLEHHALELLMRFLSPSSIASLIGALLVEHNVLLLARDIEVSFSLFANFALGCLALQ